MGIESEIEEKGYSYNRDKNEFIGKQNDTIVKEFSGGEKYLLKIDSNSSGNTGFIGGGNLNGYTEIESDTKVEVAK